MKRTVSTILAMLVIALFATIPALAAPPVTSTAKPVQVSMTSTATPSATLVKICGGHRGDVYRSLATADKVSEEKRTKERCGSFGLQYVPPSGLYASR